MTTPAAFVVVTIVTSGLSLVPQETLPGAQQPASLEGTVVSPEGRPLPGVEIRFQRGSHRVWTDAAGSFRIAEISAGVFELEIRHPDFAPVFVQLSLAPGAEVRPSEELLILRRDPSGFAERKVSGQGVFIERPQIERWNPPALDRSPSSHPGDSSIVCLGKRRGTRWAWPGHQNATRGAWLLSSALH